MTGISFDLLQAAFILYCAYALYSCLVVFYRPDDRGAIFRNLRIPALIVMYFGAPCLAMFFLYKTFWTAYPAIFWIGVIMIGPLSFLIILYFVTSQDWPVGKVLALDRIGQKTIRWLLASNFSLSIIAVIGSGVTLYLLQPAIEGGGSCRNV